MALDTMWLQLLIRVPERWELLQREPGVVGVFTQFRLLSPGIMNQKQVGLQPVLIHSENAFFSTEFMIESIKQIYTACKSLIFRNMPFEVPFCSLLLVFLWSYNRVKIELMLALSIRSLTNTIKTLLIKQSPLPSLPSPDNFRKSRHL